MNREHELCEICGMWGDARPVWVKHHRDCRHYNPYADAQELFTELVRGIEAWAADEDGVVHSSLWEAYCRAKLAIGEKVK